MKKLNKNYFTLIEIMISSAISLIAISVVSTVIVQIYDVFNETTIATKMNQYSDIVQQKILQKYQLSEAVGDKCQLSENLFEYYVVDKNEEWPDASSSELKLNSLSFSEKKTTISTETINKDEDLSQLGITITKCNFTFTKKRPTDNYESNTIKVDVEYKVEISDKIFVRQESFTTPLRNLTRT